MINNYKIIDRTIKDFRKYNITYNGHMYMDINCNNKEEKLQKLIKNFTKGNITHKENNGDAIIKTDDYGEYCELYTATKPQKPISMRCKIDAELYDFLKIFNWYEREKFTKDFKYQKGIMETSCHVNNSKYKITVRLYNMIAAYVIAGLDNNRYNELFKSRNVKIFFKNGDNKDYRISNLLFIRFIERNGMEPLYIISIKDFNGTISEYTIK